MKRLSTEKLKSRFSVFGAFDDTFDDSYPEPGNSVEVK
jgi:hypothetical protein